MNRSNQKKEIVQQLHQDQMKQFVVFSEISTVTEQNNISTETACL